MGRMSGIQIEAVKKDILKQIGAYLLVNSVTRLEFYKRIGMAPSTFKIKEANPGRFTLDELFRIANALDMHLYVTVGKDAAS